MDISRLQTQGQLTVSYVCLPSSVAAHRGYRWTGSLYEVLALPPSSLDQFQSDEKEWASGAMLMKV